MTLPAQARFYCSRFGLCVQVMESLCCTRRTRAFGRVWTTLLCAILLSAAGYLDSLSLAQTGCGAAQTTPIRVDDTTDLGTLRAAVNCTDGGTVEVNWAGVVTLDSPVSVADGTFLSITGEDDLAEAHGDVAKNSGTRLFEASAGGGLILTQMKMSGGSADEGGAISSYLATVTIVSCVFDGNFATDGNGGEVLANGGNLTITGGEFLGNNATRYGGAAYVTDGWLQVEGRARFERNNASAGGALFCSSTSAASAAMVLCSLRGADFILNRAIFGDEDGVEYTTPSKKSLDGGGAVAFYFADAAVTDSAFRENYGQVSGGALYGGDSTSVSVKGCTF